MSSFFFPLILLLLPFLSCESGLKNTGQKIDSLVINAAPPLTPGYFYNVNDPDKIWELPGALREISGISWVSPDLLACNEDERGIIYLYDLDKEVVTKKIYFSSGADFEDIAIKGDDAYLIRSDGVLVSVMNYATRMDVTKTKLKLSRGNNPEGLCWDSSNNQLLIACKFHSGIPNASTDIKAVYSFNLNENSLSETPFLTVSIKDIKNFMDQKITFQPSAIEVHPLSKNIFILASSGNLLIEMNRSGILLNVYDLKRKIFPQPEGLAFAPNGDLYISNEGRGGKGNIIRFNLQQKSE